LAHSADARFCIFRISLLSPRGECTVSLVSSCDVVCVNTVVEMMSSSTMFTFILEVCCTFSLKFHFVVFDFVRFLLVKVVLASRSRSGSAFIGGFCPINRSILDCVRVSKDCHLLPVI
jgi:hypothetical protein